METTPGTVAQAITVGLVAAGARVEYSNADDRGRFGMLIATMPDGTSTTIKIELN